MICNTIYGFLDIPKVYNERGSCFLKAQPDCCTLDHEARPEAATVRTTPRAGYSQVQQGQQTWPYDRMISNTIYGYQKCTTNSQAVLVYGSSLYCTSILSAVANRLDANSNSAFVGIVP